MIVRAIDDLEDWQFGKGKNDYKTGLDGVSQNIKTRLKSFLGDCFFALDAGIDWFNLLGAKSIAAITLSVRTTLLNTVDVLSIVEVDVKLDQERLLTVKYSVTTVYGNITNVEEINFTPITGDFLLLENGNFLLLENGGLIELE